MPIYIYKCPLCRQGVEKLNKYETVELCPNCHLPMPKLVTAPGRIKMAAPMKWPGGEGSILSWDDDEEAVHIDGGRHTIDYSPESFLSPAEFKSKFPK